MLANLFLHYAFDYWMQNNYPMCPFERYADDIVAHCETKEEAVKLKSEISKRMEQCGLELHPEKTKIVYCKDANRTEDYELHSFDFLVFVFDQGFHVPGVVSILLTSRQRFPKNRRREYFQRLGSGVCTRGVNFL